jgi:hypothetical protein
MKVTDKQIAEVKRLLKKGYSRRSCGAAIGVDGTTIQRWIEKYIPEFVGVTGDREFRTSLKERGEKSKETYRKKRQPVLDKIKKLMASDLTYKEIGQRLGLSPQTVQATAAKYLPVESAARAKVREDRMLLRQQKRELKQAEYLALFGRLRPPTGEQTPLQAAFSKMYSYKRRNALTKGLEFSVPFSELEFPAVCPVLGIQLDYRKKHSGGPRTNSSPSFDRLDPTKGYVSGNVIIVSWRANRIRNDGTADEHLRIAKFYRKLEGK